MSYTYRILLVLALPLLLAYRGGSDGGGGSVALCGSQTKPFLLDRLSLHPELADKNPEAVDASAVRPAISTKDQPEISSLFSSDQDAFNLAESRLDDWQVSLAVKDPTSAALMQIISETIRSLNYKRTTHLFNIIPRYILDASVEKKCHASTAILYLPKYGSILSSPVWDQLDRATQAGLLVHEALRQVQGLHLIGDLTDVQLQNITAQVMDVEPSEGSSFAPFMSDMLRALAKSRVDAGLAPPTVTVEVLHDRNKMDLVEQKAMDLMAREENGIPKNSDALSSERQLKPMLKELLKENILK